MRLDRAFRAAPVVMLLGPRQSGKTTIARMWARGRKAEFFDLESPNDVRRLEQPMTVLEPLTGWIVIDEAQLMPELFPVLRVLADRRPNRARFLLLESASPDFVRKVPESLAGRVAAIPMSGFDLTEVGSGNARRLWLRGGLPPSYLARSGGDSFRWRIDFIQTFLDRDLRRFGIEVASLMLHRFWSMLAHYHGQIWNGSEIGRSLGLAHTTVRRYLDILTGALVVRQLPPWFENVAKRQVKSPKAYVRDSGLLHALLGLPTHSDVESHPKLGASWEGLALEEVLRHTGDRGAYFWATQAGAELDLLVHHGGKRYGFEFKYADAPSVTRSMHVAHKDLSLERLFVVYPGMTAYPLADWAEVVPLAELRGRLAKTLPAQAAY